MNFTRRIHTWKVFLDCFYNQIEKKQPSSRVEKIYAKTSFNIPSTDYYPRWSFEVNTNKGFFMNTNYMNNNVNFTTNIDRNAHVRTDPSLHM
jgi:hypothetical protein